MSDLFHRDVPFDFILATFDVMRRASSHIFQILTKRSDRLKEESPKLDWPPNVWMGVSVETDQYLHRVDHLRATGAAIKFVSFEPLLGEIHDVDLSGINWVIVGGESGPRSRPVREEWILSLRDQCLAAKVPFFFKQWGGTRKKRTGRLLHGRTWDELPGGLPIALTDSLPAESQSAS